MDIEDSFKHGGTLSHPVVTIDKSDTAISTALTLGKAIGGRFYSVRPALRRSWSVEISVMTTPVCRRWKKLL
jgi:hypothetical protein